MTILAASFFRFGIVVTTVDYGKIFIFGDTEVGWCYFVGNEAFAEFGAVGVEHESKWATKENAGRLERRNKGGEAEFDALDNVVPDVWVGDFGDEVAIFFIDSAGGGNIFPFEFFAMPNIFGVTRFEV